MSRATRLPVAPRTTRPLRACATVDEYLAQFVDARLTAAARAAGEL